MERRGIDWSALKQRLEEVEANLRRLAAAVAPGTDRVEAAAIREVVTSAMRQLSEAVGLLPMPDPADVARVPCRFCGQMIMPAATLCGFCWRKLTPPPADRGGGARMTRS